MALLPQVDNLLKISGEGHAGKEPGTKGKESCYLPTRYIMGALCFIGVMWSVVMKSMLSMAIVAMIKSKPDYYNNSHNFSDTALDPNICPGEESSTVTQSQGGEFEWDEKMQGFVLSANAYGFIATQVLGGRLSEILGPRIILGPGLCIAGLVTILCPMAARIHAGLFIAARVLVGAASGVIMPSMNSILVRWFVTEERSFVAGIMMTALKAGYFISMLLSGTLIEVGGWELAFYVFGGVGVIFIVPWLYLAYNNPNEHPNISEEEKNFILKDNGLSEKSKGDLKVPWLAILLSGPMWVHIIMTVGHSWMQQNEQTVLPKYFNKVLHFKVQNSGLIAALPSISHMLVSAGASYLAQWFRLKGYMSRLTVYRIFNSLCGFGPAIFFLMVTLKGCNSTAAVILFVVSSGFSGFYKGGSSFNHIDLGRNFSGTLAGMSYTFYNSMAIVVPTVVGFIIDEQQTITQWNTVFYLAASIPSACTVLYLFFGSVEEQPWNKPPKESEQLGIGLLPKDKIQAEKTA